MSDFISAALERLTASGSYPEAQVKADLGQALNGTDKREVLFEHATGDGPADLFLPGRRVVIECKPRGGKSPKVGPELPGRKSNETQYHQVARYVEGVTRAEHRALYRNIPRPKRGYYIGALTDGRRWWAWKWDALNPGREVGKYGGLHGQDFQGRPEDLKVELEGLANRHAGKIWIPQNPTGLFRQHKEELVQIWHKARRSTARETQFRLWLDLIRGSGLEVDEIRREGLYLDHCLLVALARTVGQVLDNRADSPRCLSDGFVSWINDAPGGDVWRYSLHQTCDRYDWRSREVDVLRQVYMDLVPREDRKLYGEYYTPDWLAEMIVGEILDDRWLRESIGKVYEEDRAPQGIGVLDPACGSGTFLFHAARRIVAAVQEHVPSSSEETQAEIASHLVNGIDIHPVAVEMSKATLRRAFPAPADPGIYQGDSLLLHDRYREGRKQTEFFDRENMFERKGRWAFQIPEIMATLDDFDRRTKNLVVAAKDRMALPKSVVTGLEEADRKLVEEAYETLRDKVIPQEADGVWAWYIRNQMAPRAIKARKIDRIVSNPPWLRYNEIQTEPRKSQVRRAAESAGVWASRQTSTGFDLGALFASDTRSLYLTGHRTNKAAYVLNAAALRANNWAAYRETYPIRGGLDMSASHVDGAKLLNKPFEGADSCVIGLGVGRKLKRLVLKGNERISSHDTVKQIRAKTRRVFCLEELPWARSPYADRDRNGATIFPSVLVRIDPNRSTHTLVPTRQQGVWGDITPFDISEIPEEWLVEYADQNNLRAFAVERPLARACIPMENGRLLNDDEACEISGVWRRLSECYRRYRTERSPGSLTDRLNYAASLEQQFPTRLSVIYNASGQRLRAALANCVIEHKLYRIPVNSKREGDYLCGILNAPCMARSFRQARVSGRDFDKTPVVKIPIPEWDRKDERHIKIAEIAEVLRKHQDMEEVTAIESGDSLDDAVRVILPEFCR